MSLDEISERAFYSERLNGPKSMAPVGIDATSWARALSCPIVQCFKDIFYGKIWVHETVAKTESCEEF